MSVVTELSNFANITLSSLYHDITKDRLYCHRVDSFERRVIVTTMQQVRELDACFAGPCSLFFQVLENLVTIMAPILPHTAEEIHQIWHEGNSTKLSVFTRPWRTLVRLHIHIA